MIYEIMTNWVETQTLYKLGLEIKSHCGEISRKYSKHIAVCRIVHVYLPINIQNYAIYYKDAI